MERAFLKLAKPARHSRSKIIVIATVLETMGANLNKGVFIKTRSDRKLFNLLTLKASSKTRELCVRELLYADESALVAISHLDIQEIVVRFSAAAAMFGLKINVS